jgi:hypothetical protein
VSASGYNPPDTVDHALVLIADWMDEADHVIDRFFAMQGAVRSNQGDAVQRDLRRLSEWFAANPEQASLAWEFVTEGPQ